MSLDDDIRIIGSAQLFDALKPEQLRLLAFGAERLRFNSGRTIYREDDRADCGFVIASGAVDLTRMSQTGEKIVRTLGEGSVLGEIAMLTETNRLTSAVAQTDCSLIRINRSLFKRMLSEYPATAMEIHNDLSIRLKDLLAEISKLDRNFDSGHDL